MCFTTAESVSALKHFTSTTYYALTIINVTAIIVVMNINAV